MSNALKFGRKRIGSGEPVFIIAEIGINHEGDFDTCVRMVEEAAAAGADAIKLQTIDAARNYAPDTESYKLFSNSELTREQTSQTFELSRSLGVEPFTTVGDFATLDWLKSLDPPGYKISSGLLTCTPIAASAAQTGKPVLMSTGMAQTDDIDAAVEAVGAVKDGKAALFLCTSVYPAPRDTWALSSINWLSERYGLATGFSDHSSGDEAAVLAVAAGAVMIEKHFSLDPSRPGYDHPLSLDPSGFKKMVDGIRNAEVALGQAGGRSQEGLSDVRRHMSRYLGVTADIGPGQILDRSNIGFLRFSDGAGILPPSMFDMVCGASATRRLPAYSPLDRTAFSHG
ncbi:MAG: hypothetical protein GXP05_08575 [Alphaproteobacteria bacterium]|nr:hypothetical protein [Alphaproteobacteria bacterium]